MSCLTRFHNFSQSKNNKRFVSSLRGSTGNTFSKNVAADRSLNGSRKNLQAILQRSQFHKKKSLGLTASTSREKTPDFDCSGGVQLSDSSEDEELSPATTAVEKPKKSSALINSINESSGSTMVDLGKIHDNLQAIEKAKAKMMSYQSKKEAGKTKSQDENVNIADLLAMGEGAVADEPKSLKKKPSQKRSRATQNDSDSDGGWEEVEGKRAKKPKYLKILQKYEYED